MDGGDHPQRSADFHSKREGEGEGNAPRRQEVLDIFGQDRVPMAVILVVLLLSRHPFRNGRVSFPVFLDLLGAAMTRCTC